MARVERAIDALRDTLEWERVALKEGQIGMISRLAQHRDVVLNEFRSAVHAAPRGVDPAVLQKLKQDVENNQRLLAAAAKGIKSAVDRIASIRESAGRLKTYGADGRAAEHVHRSVQTQRLERKA